MVFSKQRLAKLMIHDVRFLEFQGISCPGHTADSGAMNSLSSTRDDNEDDAATMPGYDDAVADGGCSATMM